MTELERKGNRKRVSLDCGEELRTKQSFRDECDINVITAQYVRTGLLSHTNRREPMYGDFSQSRDLKASLEAVSAAEAEFGALDAQVRAAAWNDPVRFLDMLASEEGCAELEAAGLVLSESEESAPEGESKTEPVKAPRASHDIHCPQGNSNGISK